MVCIYLSRTYTCYHTLICITQGRIDSSLALPCILPVMCVCECEVNVMSPVTALFTASLMAPQFSRHVCTLQVWIRRTNINRRSLTDFNKVLSEVTFLIQLQNWTNSFTIESDICVPRLQSLKFNLFSVAMCRQYGIWYNSRGLEGWVVEGVWE